MSRTVCTSTDPGDVEEIQKFKRLLRIFGRIGKDRDATAGRKARRRLAACRLVYGSEVDSWPGYLEEFRRAHRPHGDQAK